MKKIFAAVLIAVALTGCNGGTDVDPIQSQVPLESQVPSESEPIDEANVTTSNEIIAGTSWVATDNSYMQFTDGSDFAWYQRKGATDDNYYAGTYKLYTGESALQYLTVDLSEYGLERQEMLDLLSQNSHDIGELVCLVTTNESFMLGGAEQLTEPRDSYYYGYLIENGTYLDIANMSTGSYYGFTKE